MWIGAGGSLPKCGGPPPTAEPPGEAAHAQRRYRSRMSLIASLLLAVIAPLEGFAGDVREAVADWEVPGRHG